MVKSEDDFPKLSNPARRALAAAQVRNLEELSAISEARLKKLHGIGPSAVKALKAALKARGLSLAP